MLLGLLTALKSNFLGTFTSTYSVAPSHLVLKTPVYFPIKRSLSFSPILPALRPRNIIQFLTISACNVAFFQVQHGARACPKQLPSGSPNSSALTDQTGTCAFLGGGPVRSHTRCAAARTPPCLAHVEAGVGRSILLMRSTSFLTRSPFGSLGFFV